MIDLVHFAKNNVLPLTVDYELSGSLYLVLSLSRTIPSRELTYINSPELF